MTPLTSHNQGCGAGASGAGTFCFEQGPEPLEHFARCQSRNRSRSDLFRHRLRKRSEINKNRKLLLKLALHYLVKALTTLMKNNFVSNGLSFSSIYGLVIFRMSEPETESPEPVHFAWSRRRSRRYILLGAGVRALVGIVSWGRSRSRQICTTPHPWSKRTTFNVLRFTVANCLSRKINLPNKMELDKHKYHRSDLGVVG